MFEMKPEYYIGIKMIDEQHKQLFKYADEAYELLNDEFTPDKYDRVDILLEKLYDYTVKHLADEEAYMYLRKRCSIRHLLKSLMSLWKAITKKRKIRMSRL